MRSRRVLIDKYTFGIFQIDELVPKKWRWNGLHEAQKMYREHRREIAALERAVLCDAHRVVEDFKAADKHIDKLLADARKKKRQAQEQDLAFVRTKVHEAMKRSTIIIPRDPTPAEQEKYETKGVDPQFLHKWCWIRKLINKARQKVALFSGVHARFLYGYGGVSPDLERECKSLA